MNRKPSSLRARLTAVLIGLTVASAGIVGLVLWSSDAFIEDAAVRDLMEQELDARTGGGSKHDQTLRVYLRDEAPEILRSLTPGFYEHVPIDGGEFHVLVKSGPAGELAYLAYDLSFVEHRELALALATLLVLILAGSAAVTMSGRLADRTLRPLHQLVRQISSLDPERRGERLSLQLADQDLSVFVDAMNRYMGELDALVERERAFAAAASHELRTPLAVIQGGVETLQLKGDSPTLSRIQRASVEASHELDALLALSRVHEAPPQDALVLPDCLSPVADSVLQAFGSPARLQWEAPRPVQLSAPPGALSVIFANFLRNALRAAGTGSVNVRLLPDRLEIQDDGPGIPADELSQVFEPRFRGRDGGSGMGLYIARVLAQRLGWRVSLDNVASGGAIATLQWSATAGRGDESDR